MDSKQSNTEEKKEEIERIITAFKDYRDLSLSRVALCQIHLSDQPVKFTDHFVKLRLCIYQNYSVLCAFTLGIDIEIIPPPIVFNFDQIDSALKQIASDWSAEGEDDRRRHYEPVLNAVEKYFPRKQNKVNVLVPGAGPGRLVYELARRGYDCYGNESSFIMLLSAHFILNKCSAMNLYTIHPWVNQYSNNAVTAIQTASIKFPNIAVQLIPGNGNISLISGDFIEVFENESEWDCVVTCSYIDCSKDIVTYIEKIYRILKPGGIWVNLGPAMSEFSVEAPLDFVLKEIKKNGFKLEEANNCVQTKCADPNAVKRHNHYSVFFVCRKRLLPSKNEPSLQIIAIALIIIVVLCICFFAYLYWLKY